MTDSENKHQLFFKYRIKKTTYKQTSRRINSPRCLLPSLLKSDYLSKMLLSINPSATA